MRRWQRSGVPEQVQQDPDCIRDIHTTIIIGVCGVHTVARAITENVTQQGKSVGDIKTSVTIVISATESRLTSGFRGGPGEVGTTRASGIDLNREATGSR